MEGHAIALSPNIGSCYDNNHDTEGAAERPNHYVNTVAKIETAGASLCGGTGYAAHSKCAARKGM